MIKSITLENWKSIKKAKVNVPMLCALVGKNAAGKTNLLLSIKLIKSLVRGDAIDAFQSKVSLVPSELINYSDQNNECKIAINLGDSEDLTYELTVRMILVDNLSKIQNLIIGYEKLAKITNGNEEVIYTRDTSNFKVKGSEDFPLNYEQNKLALSYYKHPDTDRIRSYFSNIVIPEFEDINNLNADVLVGLDAPSTSLANIIFDLRHKDPGTYIEFMQIVQKFMPLFKSFTEIPATSPTPDGEPNKSKFLMVAEEKGLKDTLSMLSLSAGDARTLYLLAIALRSRDNATLIIEEIENGIHPNRVMQLVDQLNTISRVKNMQIIFTTHSPLVINEMSVSNIILVNKDSESGTDFKLLDQVEQISGVKKFLSMGGNISEYINSK